LLKIKDNQDKLKWVRIPSSSWALTKDGAPEYGRNVLFVENGKVKYGFVEPPFDDSPAQIVCLTEVDKDDRFCEYSINNVEKWMYAPKP